MKFLLSVLCSFNVFSMSAGLAATHKPEQSPVKTNLKWDLNFTNVRDFLQHYLLRYYYAAYHDFVVDDGPYKVCNVDSFSINDVYFTENPTISQAPERYSNKELLHSENDKLTNDTNQEQTMQSASFSRTYIDSVAYSTTKSVGLELKAKIKFLNTKLTFQFSSTTTRTDTTQTTLTAPSQLVKVPAYSAMSVTYNAYQQHKIYDELIIGKLNLNTMIHAKFSNNFSVLSGNYRAYTMNDSILKILKVLKVLYSDGVYPDNHDVIYGSINGDVIVLANAEVETVENSLNVDIKPAVKLNKRITR